MHPTDKQQGSKWSAGGEGAYPETGNKMKGHYGERGVALPSGVGYGH